MPRCAGPDTIPNMTAHVSPFANNYNRCTRAGIPIRFQEGIHLPQFQHRHAGATPSQGCARARWFQRRPCCRCGCSGHPACLTRAGEVRRRVDHLRGHLTPKVVHSSPDLPRLSYGTSPLILPFACPARPPLCGPSAPESFARWLRSICQSEHSPTTACIGCRHHCLRLPFRSPSRLHWLQAEGSCACAALLDAAGWRACLGQSDDPDWAGPLKGSGVTKPAGAANSGNVSGDGFWAGSLLLHALTPVRRLVADAACGQDCHHLAHPVFGGHPRLALTGRWKNLPATPPRHRPLKAPPPSSPSSSSAAPSPDPCRGGGSIAHLFISRSTDLLLLWRDRGLCCRVLPVRGQQAAPMEGSAAATDEPSSTRLPHSNPPPPKPNHQFSHFLSSAGSSRSC